MISKVLVITESMIPFTTYWGACQRVYYYSKKMMDAGISVTVLCRNTTGKIDSVTNIDGIKVVGIGGKNSKEDAPSNSQKHKTSIKQKLKYIDQNIKILSDVARSVSRFVFSEPNELHGWESAKWTKSIFPYALEYISENDVDAVILSGPTFGAFKYARQIKDMGVKLILDYRDAWISWHDKPSLAARTEKNAVKYADLVVTTTDALTNELNRKYNASKCHTVMNGYDEELWNSIEKPTHNPNRLKIAHVGSINIQETAGYRNPTMFLCAAKEFTERHPDVDIEFIGISDRLDCISTELKKYVKFKNSIPVADSLKATAEADVLLVLHTAMGPSGQYILCAKVFDYIRSGNYILSIGNDAVANKNFVESTGSGIHCINNQVVIVNTLEDIYEKWRSKNLNYQVDNTEVFSRNYQNIHFMQLIQEISD